MISTSNITLRVGKKALFEDVNIKFTEGQLLWPDRCQRCGKVHISEDSFRTAGADQRRSHHHSGTDDSPFLQQDHFKYDDIRFWMRLCWEMRDCMKL